MKLAPRLIAGMMVMAFAFAFAANTASASPPDQTALACTGLLSNAKPTENAGAGSTECASTDPQPLSTADQNGHGANDPSNDNPYLATGFGQVQGGHLAGTEGKADNKFPPGQAPNGTDHNRGYECDQNPGIGNGNPAHTTCLTTQSVTPTGGHTNPPGGDESPTKDTETPTPTEETPRSDTLGDILLPPVTPAGPTATIGATIPAPTAGAALPVTGSTTLPLTALGMFLIAAGSLAVRLTSRERPAY